MASGPLMDFKMASSHLEPKQDSVLESSNVAPDDVEDVADEIAEDIPEDLDEDVAKNALLGAVFFKNHREIEAILQKHPGLANFEYDEDSGFYGTPLHIACSMYHKNLDDKDIGINFCF